MSTDAELLHRYVEQRDERAFAELVHRHLGLVYGSALRRTSGRAHLAEEIAQKVFTDLARKAGQLTNHPTLTGWLYRSTRYAAIDAIRIEQRRDKLAQSLTTTMSDESSLAESPAHWEQLRLVIDEAMDQLKEQDREVMLLRFFEGLTFVEIGARLNLSENTARMRTERALEKLRFKLGKRGITSTAALAGLLTDQSLVAAPASLVASVTTTALAAAPADAVTSFLTTLLMNKIVLSTLSAAVAAGLTTVAWAAFADQTSSNELSSLRAENARLTQVAATGTGAAAVAEDVATRSPVIVQAVEQRLAKIQPSGYRNRGLATPRDAALSYMWAADSGDVEALAAILTFDEAGRFTIEGIYAGVPASIRAQYHTPEEFMAFLYIAHTLLRPMPKADVAEKMTAELALDEVAPGQVQLRNPKKPKGLIFVQSADGWQLQLSAQICDQIAGRVLSNEMLAKLGQN